MPSGGVASGRLKDGDGRSISGEGSVVSGSPAGLLTPCTMVPSLAHFITSGGAAAAEARLASVGDLLDPFGGR